MKALKVLGVIAAMIGIAAVVFWLGWLRAPDGAEVCANVMRVLEADAKQELPAKVKDGLVKDCERRAKPPEFGRVPWVKRMKCMKDAQSRGELDACEKGTGTREGTVTLRDYAKGPRWAPPSTRTPSSSIWWRSPRATPAERSGRA